MLRDITQSMVLLLLLWKNSNLNCKMNIVKVIIYLIIIFNSLTICTAQTKDSICVHYFNFDNWQKFRPIDSLESSKYKINSEYFRKFFYRDTLYIKLNELYCINGRVLVGEYTNKDSNHVTDYIEDTLPKFRFEGFCKVHISKNQLSQIKRITLGPNDSYKFLKCVIYITTPHESKFEYTLTQKEIPDSALNIIRTLKDDSVIIIDDIEVLHRNRIRRLPPKSYAISD